MSLPQILHIGDALAIIGFALLVAYFWRKPKRTTEENILLAFSISGLVADIIFTGLWITKKM